MSTYWSRAIVLVDMDAFFASIEQLDNPALIGQPVVVTNGKMGSCIITSSYEARAHGIKTGMRLREARTKCPNLVRCPSRPSRYAEISTRMMQALEAVTPDIEVYSIDEAFLDITNCQRLHGDPISIAHKVQTIIWESTGLTCSVGLSSDKTSAKYAAKKEKPAGLTIIKPEEVESTLANVPVTELCGIADGVGNYLAQHGVLVCGDMKKIPISVLSRRFGNLGRRIWLMCQGKDPEPVHTESAAPKSMGHGKVLPPQTNQLGTVLAYFMHLSEKLAARMRAHDMTAQRFFIGLRANRGGWLGDKPTLATPTDDGYLIYQACKNFVKQTWNQCQTIQQVQVTALDPQAAGRQTDLFNPEPTEKKALLKTIDAVNTRYGERQLSPARLLEQQAITPVIPPAWRPTGPRQVIQQNQTESTTQHNKQN